MADQRRLVTHDSRLTTHDSRLVTSFTPIPAEWVAAIGAEQLIVGVDTRHGRVATKGWLNVTDVEGTDFCRLLSAAGIRRVIYTDVGRDGLLSGPDVEGTAEIARILSVIGSGGVATVAHLNAPAPAGAGGAIVGTALYERRITLQQAPAAGC